MSGKRLYVSLGFDVTNLLGSLLDRRFGNGDSLVLVVPKNRSERNEEAIRRVELLLSELSSRGCKIEMEVLELDEHKPMDSLRILVTHIKNWDGEVYLDAIGGLRVFCVVMAIAASLVPKKDVHITSIAENSGRRVGIPRVSLALLASITGAKLDVLRAIKRGFGTMNELERCLNKDKSTLSRHLASLEDMGLIEKVTSKKPVKYEVTEVGEIVELSLSQR
jgi:CRISPR locus-related DNA-binding protein